MEKIKCIHCQHDVILREGQRYCKYCGKPLMNKCSKSHCQKPLDDDAAFCPYCGHESKFKIKGIIRSTSESSFSTEETSSFDKVEKNKFIPSISYIPNPTLKKNHSTIEQILEEPIEQEVFPIFL